MAKLTIDKKKIGITIDIDLVKLIDKTKRKRSRVINEALKWYFKV